MICHTTGLNCFGCVLGGLDACPDLPGGLERVATKLVESSRRLSREQALKLARSIDVEHGIVKRPPWKQP